MGFHPALRRTRVFDRLDERALEAIAALGEERAFGAGDDIFREHDPPDSLYVVLEGRASTALRDKNRTRKPTELATGDHFGRAMFVEGQLRYVSASGVAPGRLFVLSSVGCAALLATIPPGSGARATPPGASVGGSAVDLDRIQMISGAVAGLAHEVGTPLGVIENAASFISDQLAPSAPMWTDPRTAAEARQDIVEASLLIQKNVAHAAKLVASFKKLSVGQLAEPRERVDLTVLIDDVLNVFRSKALSMLPPGPKAARAQSGQQRLFLAASRLKVSVICTLSPAERQWAGFPGLFSRVLLNLLTNIDRHAYAAESEGKVDIAVTAGEVGPGVEGFVVAVRDFGKGIRAADLPRVFDPFFTTARHAGGTGLGLAMVHNIVTQGLNGTVTVRSVVDEGTTFEVRFPAAMDDPAPESSAP